MTEENLPPEDGDEGFVSVPAEEVEPDQPIDDDTPPSIEDIAADMGWSPQDQWRGDPDKWKPAHEFVRNTAEINRRLATQLKGFDERLERINRTNEAMMERALAKQREELLAARQEAFESGDGEKFNEVERKLKELPEPGHELAPEAQEFVARHANWWGKDREATAWAQQRAGQLAQQGLSPSRQLQVVERELATYFPEYAPQEKPKPKVTQLTQPGKRGAVKKELTLSDLPKEAQEAAKYFEKKGVSIAEYLKSYKEQEGLA